MITIDYHDKRPLYEQVDEKIQQLIVKGILKEDEKMPSVRALAIELSINPNTIQRAYSKLESDGFIYTVKGRGNFVSKKDKWADDSKADAMDELTKALKKAFALHINKDEISALADKVYEEVNHDRS